jgi:uncharacterized cupredoxin-like copper-binding protein
MMKTSLLAIFCATTLTATSALAHPGGHAPDTGMPDPRGSGAPLPPPAPERAYGRAGDAAKSSRTVAVELTSNGGCSPGSIPVKQGETLRLVAKNAGAAEQDLALGTASDLKAHAEMVQKFPQMQVSQANRVTVRPGESRDLVWQFTRTGEFNLACGAPTRFDAAVAGKVVVSPR